MTRIRKFLLVFSVPVVTPALELSEISTEGGGWFVYRLPVQLGKVRTDRSGFSD